MALTGIILVLKTEVKRRGNSASQLLRSDFLRKADRVAHILRREVRIVVVKMKNEGASSPCYHGPLHHHATPKYQNTDKQNKRLEKKKKRQAKGIKKIDSNKTKMSTSARKEGGPLEMLCVHVQCVPAVAHDASGTYATVSPTASRPSSFRPPTRRSPQRNERP